MYIRCELCKSKYFRCGVLVGFSFRIMFLKNISFINEIKNKWLLYQYQGWQKTSQ